MSDLELMIDQLHKQADAKAYHLILADAFEDANKPTFAEMLRTPTRMFSGPWQLGNFKKKIEVVLSVPEFREYGSAGLYFFKSKGKHYYSVVGFIKQFESRRSAIKLARKLIDEGAEAGTPELVKFLKKKRAKVFDWRLEES